MFEKLTEIEQKYLMLRDQMLDPAVASDPKQAMVLGKEITSLQELYDLSQEYNAAASNRDEAEELLQSDDDPDVVDLATQQLDEAKQTLTQIEEKLKLALLPKDLNDEKNIFLEIRPAAGGDEAGLFATELLRMYLMYAQNKGRKPELIQEDLSDAGGLKFAMMRIAGERVYSFLKRESGVHRVQRIPSTESSGRIHTSTVTVAVMPEADDMIDVSIDQNDIEIDTFAASSAGGQNANKNQTGVRIRHKPSGIIVTIADSKSQRGNKEKAFQILKAKLYQAEQDKKQQESREMRSDQIGTGDRSEKIRTYNFPQDRVTDHRIKVSRSNLQGILAGNIDGMVETMAIENQAKLLAAASA